MHTSVLSSPRWNMLVPYGTLIKQFILPILKKSKEERPVGYFMIIADTVQQCNINCNGHPWRVDEWKPDYPFSTRPGATSLPLKFLSTIKCVIMMQDSITNPPFHILTFEHHRTSTVSSLKLSMNWTLYHLSWQSLDCTKRTAVTTFPLKVIKLAINFPLHKTS